MKKIFILITSVLLSSCISTSVTINPSVTSQKSEEISTPITKKESVKQSNPDMLVGKQNRKALEQEPFGSWFNKNYEEYTVDQETVSELAPYLKIISIKAFMGTWCGDSKRETPTFYKILDKANFDYSNLELITVTRAKDTPEGYEKDLDIIRVPTFIFYKNGKEIGRYVEFSRESLEKDMLAIVSGAPYKHSYED